MFGFLLSAGAFVAGVALGGLLVLAAIAFYAFVWSTVPVGDMHVSKLWKRHDEAEETDTDTAALVSPPRRDMTGFLTARRSFLPVQPAALASASSSSTASAQAALSSLSPAPTSSTGSFLPRSIRAAVPAPAPREHFFGKLRGPILYLYNDDADDAEPHAAIDLQSHDVELYPEGVPDGELFAKRNCIRLVPARKDAAKIPSVERSMKIASGRSGEEAAAGDSSSTTRPPSPLPNPTPWYIFVKSNTTMEDWYLALKQGASKLPNVALVDQLGPVFSKVDMAELVETLDAHPDPVPMRWLNGILGRIFLGINRTAWLQDFIVGKINKKLSRIQIPSFLSSITITSATLSSPPPVFSRPMLKTLTKAGEASFEVGLVYRGEVRISIATEATIQLGARLGSYKVPLVLAVVVKEVEGNLLVRIKEPPSSRLWYGFTKEPKMTIEVEPVVSARQIKWSMILKPIEKQVREIIIESVVLPNMDDIAWFNTSDLFQRGGIFAEAARTETVSEQPSTSDPSLDPPSTNTDAASTPSVKTSDANNSSNLRKRHGSVDLSAREEIRNKDIQHPITRVETAPPSEMTGSGTTSATSIRNWFTRDRAPSTSSGQSGSPTVSAGDKPIVIDHPTFLSSSPNASADSLELAGREGASLARSSSAPRSSAAGSSRLSSSPSSEGTETSLSTSLGSSGQHPSSTISVTPTLWSTSGNASHGATSGGGDTSNSLGSVTSSSVINALRSRDKQAISSSLNQAKDVAKKWGAGWAARRRVGGGTGEPSPSTLDVSDGENVSKETSALATSPSSHEDRPLQSRLAGALRNSGVASEANPAVPRREEETKSDVVRKPVPDYGSSDQSETTVGSVPLTQSNSAPSGQQQPPSSDNSASSSPFPPSSNSTTRPTSTSGRNFLAAVSAPSLPTTKLHVDTVPSPSPSSSYSSDLPETRSTDGGSQTTARPVRTQPLARSANMAIPGIPNARRTEAMSFGSSPTEPPAPIIKRDTSPAAGEKSRDRLSSVYRLFGSPALTPTASTTTASAEATAGEAQPATADDAFPSAAPATSLTPPPLPERTTSSTGSSTSDEAPSVGPLPRPIPSSSPQPKSGSDSTSVSPTAKNSLLAIAAGQSQTSSTPFPSSTQNTQVTRPLQAPPLPARRDASPSYAPAVPPPLPPRRVSHTGEEAAGGEGEKDSGLPIPIRARTRINSEETSASDMFRYED